MELSKPDKKIARLLIEKGLRLEYIRGLSAAESIIQQWKNGAFEDERSAYLALFTTIDKFDNQLSKRYDNLGGSMYALTVLQQVKDGIHNASELDAFSPEVRERMRSILGLGK